MWEKWILLAAAGAITCLTRGTIGEVEACPGGASFALQMLDEIVSIVTTVGEPPSEAFLNSARQQLSMKGSPSVSSMYRDIQRGRPIEVEAIIGDLVRRSQKSSITAPLLSVAYIHLLVYQNRVASAQ